MPKIGGPVILEKDLLKPFWQTADGETVRLYLGNVLDVLKRLPSKSVQCVVTSPPYWGLRDYGTGSWEGGDEGCDHKSTRTDRGKREELPDPPAGWAKMAQEHRNLTHCLRCGAIRIDSQLGSEKSPDCERIGEPLVSLREDLTEQEREYVLRELLKRCVL